jgi:hypothetical protein
LNTEFQHFIHDFKDLAEREVCMWKEAQRQGDFMENGRWWFTMAQALRLKIDRNQVKAYLNSITWANQK